MGSKINYKGIIVVIGAIFLLGASFAGAEDTSAVYNNKTFRDIANELRCPTCQGLSVLDSDATFSVQIKEEVARQLDAGKTKAEVLQFFSERYGPWILRNPPKEGFNIVVWLLPLALLVCGPILVWYFVWRKTQNVSPDGVRSVSSILEQMEGELRGMRKKVG
ncbi:MAG: cytochrome c-type biogenesis protein CcmH [Oligoflexales bacterium]